MHIGTGEVEYTRAWVKIRRARERTRSVYVPCTVHCDTLPLLVPRTTDIPGPDELARAIELPHENVGGSADAREEEGARTGVEVHVSRETARRVNITQT